MKDQRHFIVWTGNNEEGNPNISVFQNESAPLEIYSHPKSGSQYIIGVDPGFMRDPTVIQVLDAHTKEHCAMLVISTDDGNYWTIAPQLWMIGWYFNRALCTIEINGPGRALALALNGGFNTGLPGYPNVNWQGHNPGISVNKKVSAWLMAAAESYVKSGKVIHDPETATQLSAFSSRNLPNDRAIAFALALIS